MTARHTDCHHHHDVGVEMSSRNALRSTLRRGEIDIAMFRGKVPGAKQRHVDRSRGRSKLEQINKQNEIKIKYEVSSLSSSQLQLIRAEIAKTLSLDGMFKTEILLVLMGL